MFQNEWMRCEERSGEWIELKRSRIICKFVNFSCLLRVSTFFVFVSCFDFGFSCLYRYTRNTKHEVFLFRVPNSALYSI